MRITIIAKKPSKIEDDYNGSYKKNVRNGHHIFFKYYFDFRYKVKDSETAIEKGVMFLTSASDKNNINDKMSKCLRNVL